MRKYFVLFVTVMLVICAYIVGLNVGHEDGYTDAMNDYDYEYIYNDGYAHGYWDGISEEDFDMYLDNDDYYTFTWDWPPEDSSGSWNEHENGRAW